MFDLSRLGESIVGLISGARPSVPTDLTGALEAAGLDASVLQGLTEGQALEFLSNFGIDASQLDLSRFTELAPQGVLGALQDALGHRDL